MATKEKKNEMKVESSRVKSSHVKSKKNATKTHKMAKNRELSDIFHLQTHAQHSSFNVYTHIMLHIIVFRSDEDEDCDDDDGTTAAMMMAKTTTSTITTNNE